MPIYEYECGACGDTHEFIQKFSEGPKRKCPSCGKLKLRKSVTAAAFHLKGDGWYVTDFRDKGKGKSGKDEGSGSSSESKSDSGSDSKSDSKSESKAGDSKSSKSSKSGDKKKGKSGGKSAAA